MFYDLCLPDTSPDNNGGDSDSIRARLATALSLGYLTVAVSTTLDRCKLTPEDRCKRQPIDFSALLAADGKRARPASGAAASAANAPGNHRASRRFRQLSRLTVAVDTPAQCTELAASTAIAHSYDLFAVQPASDRAFALACTTLDCDIISLDLTRRLTFRLRPPLLKSAADRGVAFEILYGPAIASVASRRQLFANAIALVRAAGGAAIVSSGAAGPGEMRAPHDVANLATLFGLSPGAGKAAIATAAEAVVRRAKQRRGEAGAGGGFVTECGAVLPAQASAADMAWPAVAPTAGQHDAGVRRPQTEQSAGGVEAGGGAIAGAARPRGDATMETENEIRL